MRDDPLPLVDQALQLLQQLAAEAEGPLDPELLAALAELEAALPLLRRDERRDPVQGQQGEEEP